MTYLTSDSTSNFNPEKVGPDIDVGMLQCSRESGGLAKMHLVNVRLFKHQ